MLGLFTSNFNLARARRMPGKPSLGPRVGPYDIRHLTEPNGGWIVGSQTPRTAQKAGNDHRSSIARIRSKKGGDALKEQLMTKNPCLGDGPRRGDVRTTGTGQEAAEATRHQPGAVEVSRSPFTPVQ